MPLPPQSPVPPADGIVTDERLSALLRLAAEYDEVDFKTAVDLSSTRGDVEMAKDVGAMQVKGGYIVIGVDDNGEPTGAMDGANASPLDPANLVPKMQRYLHGSLDIATGVLTRDGHTVVLVCVKRSPRGCAFFKIDGQYQSPRGDVLGVENCSALPTRTARTAPRATRTLC
jgi:predicted HTH transcriptional regulator